MKPPSGGFVLSEAMMTDWKPSADLPTLRARAALLSALRAFFNSRGVLEVETPLLSAHATVDRHIDSFLTGPGRPTCTLSVLRARACPKFQPQDRTHTGPMLEGPSSEQQPPHHTPEVQAQESDR